MNPALELLQLYPSERKAKLFKGITPSDPIDLSIGEPKHAPDGSVVETLNKYALEGVTKYPPTVAEPALTNSIANFAKRELGVTALDTQIQILCGSGEGLFSIPGVCVSPQKKVVLIPNPFYQVYEGATIMAQGEPYFYNLIKENNFQPDFSAIPEKILKQTALLYLNYPSNPCSVSAARETLEQAITLSQKYNFVVVSDESYFSIWFDKPAQSILKVANDLGVSDFKNLIAFHTLSKRSSLPGLRSGAMIGDAKLIASYLRIRFMERKVMPLNVQRASVVAWDDSNNYREKNRLRYQVKRDNFIKSLKDLTTIEIPESTFFIWWKIPEKFSCGEDFAQKLYKETGISTFAGAFFAKSVETAKSMVNPGEKYIRVALVENEEKTDLAISRIRSFLEANI